MRLDLRRVRVPIEPQGFDKCPRDGRPRNLRIGREVGVVVADGPVQLAQEAHGGHLLALAVEAVDDVRHLLAQRRRRGRLAVRAGEHRQLGVVVRELAHRGDHLVHLRQQGLGASLAQHQRVREIVDVLGGAGEVDELTDRLQLGIASDLFLEEVLDCLHVVVRRALDVLDALRVLDGEALDDALQQMGRVLAERRHLADRRIGGERLQPADLDQHPVPDEAVLAEDRPQFRSLAGIAAVDGGNRGQGGKVHVAHSLASFRRTYCRMPPCR